MDRMSFLVASLCECCGDGCDCGCSAFCPLPRHRAVNDESERP